MHPAAAPSPVAISWSPCYAPKFPFLGYRNYKNCSCSQQSRLRRAYSQDKGRWQAGANGHVRLQRSRCVRRLRTIIRGSASDKDNERILSKSELSDAEQVAWQASCEQVIDLGFSSEEADSMMLKAFGWKRSSYWGEDRKPTVPDPNTISAVISYLRELGMSDPDLVKVMKKLPEVLGLLVEEDMKKNVAALEKTWGISGNILKNLLLRTPGALGFTIDCRGDCQGLCTRCWARL